MRLRRVAIDIKKQVRGRTVRTAVISLAGQRDSHVHIVIFTERTNHRARPVPVLSPGRQCPPKILRKPGLRHADGGEQVRQ